MRIALVCRHFTLDKGGMEKYTVNLSRQLLGAGQQVHVFCNSHMEQDGIVFHHVPIIRLNSPIIHLSYCHLLKKRLDRQRFDIIHSMERTFYQDIYRVSDGINPVQMIQRYPNPKVRALKAIGPRRQVLSFLERGIYEKKGCIAIMTNSELVKRQILEHYRVDPDKITVIYNSVDTKRFNPAVRNSLRETMRNTLGILPFQRAVLFVSNNFKLKRLDLVLSAVRRLDNENIRLMVIGTDNAEPYRKMADDWGLGGQVLFLGPRKKMEKYYAAADIFVLPTLYDPFANVCLEAMACGLPVLTTRNNGAAELIRNGREGFVLTSSSPDELALRMEILLSRDGAAMGGTAARTAEKFTPEKHLFQVLKLYERVRQSKTF